MRPWCRPQQGVRGWSLAIIVLAVASACASGRVRVTPDELNLRPPPPSGYGECQGVRIDDAFMLGDDRRFGAGAFTLSDVSPGPAVTSQVVPQYPGRALRAKLEGTVDLEVVVEPDGTVGDIRIVTSLDREHGLDGSAVCAAKQWRFRPGRIDLSPVPVIVPIQIRFRVAAPRRDP